MTAIDVSVPATAGKASPARAPEVVGPTVRRRPFTPPRLEELGRLEQLTLQVFSGSGEL
jgi:hypothetical protein